MKKIIVVLALLAVCAVLISSQGRKKEDYLVKINRYTITAQRFEDEFKSSAFAKNDTPESRKEFLASLIKRKVILQDAQAKGLDKDKEFLMMIERFWEQSLLQRAIDQKNREIAGSINIPDAAVEAEYKAMLGEGKTDKPYEQVYKQIKWSLTRAAESKAMEDWVAGLQKASEIKVNGAYAIHGPITGGTNGD